MDGFMISDLCEIKRHVVDKINASPRDQNEWKTTYLKRKENNKCVE